jgi:transposase-like protein
VTEQQLLRMAKRRPAILRHAEETTGNVALSCRYHGISRQASYTWRRRYEQHGLEGFGTAPTAPRSAPTPPRRGRRQDHPPAPAPPLPRRAGQDRDVPKRHHDGDTSASGVWRALKRLGMNRLPASRRHQRQDRRWQRYEQPLPGHRLRLDLKLIAPLPGPRRKPYRCTAIDDCTRLRVLRTYARCDQQAAIWCLDYLLGRLRFRVEVIQAGNGAEFGASFHWHVLDRASATPAPSHERPGSTARSRARIAPTPRSSTAGWTASWSTTPRPATTSSAGGRTSTTATDLMAASAARPL